VKSSQGEVVKKVKNATVNSSPATSSPCDEFTGTLKFGVYNSSKCYFRQITLFVFIRCQYSIGLDLGLGLGLMYKYSIAIPWFLKIRCRRVDQSASYPVRELTDRELVYRQVVL